jgi:lactate dehydrogenase-like 2-hydroxyacid dehydrogenase/phosphoserine aminotransferase
MRSLLSGFGSNLSRRNPIRIMRLPQVRFFSNFKALKESSALQTTIASPTAASLPEQKINSIQHEVKKPQITLEPIPLKNNRFGPGPLPLPEMNKDEFKAFCLDFTKKYVAYTDKEWEQIFPMDKTLEAYLDRELKDPTLSQSGLFGAIFTSILDGILHRSTKELDGVSAIALTKDTTKIMHELLQLPKGARIAFQDGGGHGAGYNIWLNVLAKDTSTPVVVLDFGAFGEQWATDLDNEFAGKGFIGKVVRVKVADGEVPTINNVKARLTEAGIDESQKINMLFTSHETGTGAMVAPELMQEFIDWDRTDKIVSDFTSAVLCQKIPSLGAGKVFGFGALQKVPRGPNLGLVVIPAGYDDFLTANGALPNPKYTSFCINQDGKLQVKETLFSGDDITRSMDMMDILRLYFSAICLMNRGGLDTSVERAQNSRLMVQAEIQKRIDAANGKPEMVFLVSEQRNRGNFNIVLKKGAGLYSISTPELQSIKAEARRILATDGLARNLAPFPKGDPDTIFRFTTLGIENLEQAKQLVDALYYGLNKAIAKMQSKEITLVAEDQFLYSTSEKVEAAIVAKTKELAAKGITFIDARNSNIDYAALKDGKYVIYMPDIQGAQITGEYQKIQAVSVNSAIIVAAKTIPANAQFKIFVREGAGTNNIPKEQAEKDGHLVTNCPGVNTSVTARNTLNAVAGHPHIQHFSDMALAGKASALNLQPLYGTSPDVDFAALNNKVSGKIVAVLGAGDIGTQTILGLLQSDAKEVRVYNRSLVGKYTEDELQILQKRFPKLTICQSIDVAMNGSNIVINHMALVAGKGGTENAVGEKQIASMADGAEIIDAARPGIINPDALIAAHKNGKLSRVVVDFDTPDKAPNDIAISKLFAYANEASGAFLYSPHAFADVCPDTRLNMLDAALEQTGLARTGKVRNFAGIGSIPQGFENLGKKAPNGIIPLSEYLRPSLAQPTKAEETFNIVSPALAELYGINAAEITPMQGGRLSNTYIVTTNSGEKIFVKIARKSAVPENIAFSVKVTEYGREKLGMPFPQTFKNTSGKLYSTIPQVLNNNSVPDYLQDSTITVVQFHEKPAKITAENTLKRYESLGRYLGEYYKFKDFSLEHKNEARQGPVEIKSIVKMFSDTFNIRNRLYSINELDALNDIGRKHAENLRKFTEDKVAHDFGNGLENGFLGKAFSILSDLSKREQELDKSSFKKGLLNNDIKLSNVFDDGVSVKLAFDLDTITTEDFLVKDLGRAIALNCFDSKTGSLQPATMLALIRGRVESNPLNKNEADALGLYIELGIMTSAAIRTTYLKDMMQGQKPAYEVDRLNPDLHLKEINSLQSWLKENDLTTIIPEMQNSWVLRLETHPARSADKVAIMGR